jgi:hypothetical protein
MTTTLESAIRPRVGRKKRWHEIMGAPFPQGTFARMHKVMREDEDKTDFVRAAVEHELERREATLPASKPPRRKHK